MNEARSTSKVSEESATTSGSSDNVEIEGMG